MAAAGSTRAFSHPKRRKITLIVVIMLLVASVVLGGGHTAAASSPKRNILFIAVDDLRPRFGRAYNHTEVLTPHMDAFLEDGLVFRNSYVNYAICGPSRASMLTGRRPDSTHVGVDVPGPGPWCWCRRGQFVTLPAYLRQHGVFTSGMSKIFHPDACGEGNVDAHCGALETHADGDDTNAWSEPYFVEPECEQWGTVPCPKTPANNGTMGVSWMESPLTDDQQTDGQVAAHAVKTINEWAQRGIGVRAGGEQRDEVQTPFMLAVGFHKPHLPHIVPKEYFDLYPVNVSLPPNPRVPDVYEPAVWFDSSELRSYNDAAANFKAEGFGYDHPLDDVHTREHRRAYFAATTFVDRQIGRVLDSIAQSPFANTTAVVLWSDHGWHLGDTNSWSKYTNFETATNNVLLVKVPGQAKFGATNRLVEGVDVYPTILDLAGVPLPRACNGDEPPSAMCLQGESFAGELGVDTQQPPQPPKSAAFSQFPHTAGMGYAIRVEEPHAWRYVEWVHYDYHAYRPDWNNVTFRELYDMETDYHEAHNVAFLPENAALVANFSARIHAGVDGAPA